MTCPCTTEHEARAQRNYFLAKVTQSSAAILPGSSAASLWYELHLAMGESGPLSLSTAFAPIVPILPPREFRRGHGVIDESATAVN